MLDLFFYLVIFIFGLIVGSFLNCVIYRLEMRDRGGAGEGLSLLGSSFCPRCQHKLSWQDLIPIFSFLILKGKCRYCQKPISIQYPLVELATGILFPFVFYRLSTLPAYVITLPGYVNLILLLAITCFLIIIFVYDLKHYIIPDKIIYPAIATIFLYQLFRILEFGNWNLFGIWNLEFGILRPILSAVLASGFFLIIVLISQGKWMGAGDIKLAFLMGLFLSFPKILVVLFLAFFIGAITGTGLILAGKKTLKSEVPFGPFLVSGTFIALFWGENIINWYFNFFL